MKRTFLMLASMVACLASIGRGEALGADQQNEVDATQRAVTASDSEIKSLPDAWSGGVRMVPIKTPKGDFRVWVKRVGNNPKLKLLLLHGGPGATHDVFEVFDSFMPAEGVEYYYYDQLGSGRSDRPNDDDLWTVERFVSEVEQVRAAIGADQSNFCLLGQSWGGILAIEYALAHQDQLKCLIISNMMASIPAYNDYANRVLKPQMDPAKLKLIEELEKNGQTDDPRYMGTLMPEFYEKHVLRRPAPEWPEPVVYALTPGPMNKHIYELMQGPSEMGASGRLEHWDRFAELKAIKVPTLVISGKYDTMDPAHLERMAKELPRGELAVTNGSHLAMYDDQPTFFAKLTAFLRKMKD